MSPDGAELARFVLEQTGRRILGEQELAANLGLRRFLRLDLDGPPGRLIARIEAPEDPAGRPAGSPPEPPLEPLRSVLEAGGLPVPKSLGHHGGLGIDLLEDLGDESLFDAARAQPGRAHSILSRVCDLIPTLQSLDAPAGLAALGRRLDAASFAYKADLFATHSLPLALGRGAREDERSAVVDAFAFVAERSEEAPQRLAHRDLQSRNVMLRGGVEPVLIDLQGALLAPPEYDLVCLLRDSYLELSRAEVEALLQRVRPRLPDALDPASFALRFDLLTLTRKGKDHARFLDVAGRRGDTDSLRFLPATTRALREAAERLGGLTPRLEPLLAWIARLPEAVSAPGPGAGP